MAKPSAKQLLSNKTSGYGMFPDPFQVNKDYQWYLKYAKAAWDATGGRGIAGFYGWAKFETIDQYAVDEQSVKTLKSIFKLKDSNTLVHDNIDYRPFPILQELSKKALARLLTRRVTFETKAMDPVTTFEHSEALKNLEAKIRLREGFRKLMPREDESAVLPKLPGEPDTLADFEIAKTYSLKHKGVLDIERVLSSTLEKNKYEQLLNEFYANTFYYGYGGFREYLDSDGSIKIKAVDPKRVVSGYSEESDFSDAEYIGEVPLMTIAEVRERSKDGFSEEAYKEMAKGASTRFGNPRWVRDQFSDYNAYKDFRVAVLDLELLTMDHLNFEQGEDRFENKRVTYAAPHKRGAKYKRHSFTSAHRLMWVIETDYIFDYGPISNMKRLENGLGDAVLNFVLYAPGRKQMGISGMIEEVSVLVDHLNHLWVKYQQCILEIRPKGLQIDPSALVDAADQMGTDSKSLLELIYMRGVALVSSTKRDGRNVFASAVQELSNGMGPEVGALWGQILEYIELIKRKFGINNQTEGASADPRILKDSVQTAIKSSAYSTADIVYGAEVLFEKLCYRILNSAQDLAKVSDWDFFKNSIGVGALDFFKSAESFDLRSFGFVIRQKTTEEEKDFLLQLAVRMYESNQISTEDLFLVKSLDNLRYAEAILAHKAAMREQKLADAQQASTQQASLLQMQLEQQKHQMALELEALKGDYRLREAGLLAQAEQEAIMLRETMKRRVAELKEQYALERNRQTAGTKAGVELAKLSHNDYIGPSNQLNGAE